MTKRSVEKKDVGGVMKHLVGYRMQCRNELSKFPEGGGGKDVVSWVQEIKIGIVILASKRV